jgi:hypothetical protein
MYRNGSSYRRPNQSIKPTAVDFLHVYEVRPRKDKRGVDLIGDALPFGGTPHNEANSPLVRGAIW